MKIINLFLVIIILYLIYKIFTHSDSFVGTVSVNTNINAKKNVFINYKETNLEQINDYKNLDLSKSNLIVNNVDEESININNKLCIGNFCLDKSKLKTIAGKIDGPQFYKTITDNHGDKVKEKIYYNNDCSLKNTDTEFNKCEITNQENLPDEMCFHHIGKKIIYESIMPLSNIPIMMPVTKSSLINESSYNGVFNPPKNINRNKLYLELSDIDNDITYKISGKYKNNSITEQIKTLDNTTLYECSKLFDIINNITIISGTPEKAVSLYIYNDKKTCINSKHFEILNGKRGLKLKHNTSNIPLIIEEIRLKQIEFMIKNPFPEPENKHVYITDESDDEQYIFPPSADYKNGNKIDKSKPHDVMKYERNFLFKYPNFVSDWYRYQVKDRGRIGKTDKTCKGGDKSERLLPLIYGETSRKCCVDFLDNLGADELTDIDPNNMKTKKGHDKVCLSKFKDKWAKEWENENEIENETNCYNSKERNEDICKSGNKCLTGDQTIKDNCISGKGKKDINLCKGENYTGYKCKEYDDANKNCRTLFPKDTEYSNHCIPDMKCLTGGQTIKDNCRSGKGKRDVKCKGDDKLRNYRCNPVVSAGYTEYDKKKKKDREGDENSIRCSIRNNKSSKWRLPPLKNNFKGDCCRDVYPGYTDKQCKDKFEKEYPDYKIKNEKKDRGAIGKFDSKCPSLIDGITKWRLPDGHCCNDNDSNGRYYDINTKRDCIITYHNKYSSVNSIQTQPEPEYDNKYMMPYYIDFRQVGSGIEGTTDQLLFKNDYECANSNSLYKLNPKFDPRKYPLYRSKIEELNCKDYETNPNKCWKNNKPPADISNYDDVGVEASLNARLCPHTCKGALEYTFNKKKKNNLYECPKENSESDKYRNCIFGIDPKNQREPMRKIDEADPPPDANVKSKVEDTKPNPYINDDGLVYNNGWIRECPSNNSDESKIDDGKCIPKGTGKYSLKEIANATLALAEGILEGNTGEDLKETIKDSIDDSNNGKNLSGLCKSGIAYKDKSCWSKDSRNMKKYRCAKRYFKNASELSEEKNVLFDGPGKYAIGDDDKTGHVSYDEVGKYCLKYQSKEINQDGVPENTIKKRDKGTTGKFKLYCPRLKPKDDGDYSPKKDAFKQRWGFDTIPKSANPNIIWSSGCCASSKGDSGWTGERSTCIDEYNRALKEDETSELNNHGYYILPIDQDTDISYNGYYIDINNNNVKYILKDNAIAKASSVLTDIQNHRASDNGICGIDKFNGANAKYFCNSKNSNNGTYDNLCNPITNLEKQISEIAGREIEEPEEETEVATNCDNIKEDNPDYDNICISDNRCLKSSYKGIYQTKDNNCVSGKAKYTPGSCKKKKGERNYRCVAQPRAEVKPPDPEPAPLTYEEKLKYKNIVNTQLYDSPLDKSLTEKERQNIPEINYIMTPAKDVNGSNISSDSYFHAHTHIHP